jgi:hypothetical protein
MGDERPEPVNWHHYFRRRADRRSFHIALGVSVLFHISMITVFRIVIYFPREEIQFRDLAIIPIEIHAPPEPPAAMPPAGPPPSSGGQLSLRGVTTPPGESIELPTLEFAELERLRVRQEGAQAISRFDDLFEEPAGDSWSRFSRTLSGLGRTLAELRLSGVEDEGSPLSLDAEGAPGLALRPAEGFEARILWDSEPKDRQLLFAPPVDALWTVDPAQVTQPIEVVLQVNELGQVVNVFSPTVQASELVDAVQATVLRYRFEPLNLDGRDEQKATLRIQAARPEPLR